MHLANNADARASDNNLMCIYVLSMCRAGGGGDEDSDTLSMLEGTKKYEKSPLAG